MQQDPSPQVVALDRLSTACPRYDSTRSTVVTSSLAADDEDSLETLYIDGNGITYRISHPGCTLSSRGFSPSDEWLLVSAVCFANDWEQSGLYALPMANVADVAGLADMSKLVDGNLMDTAWHPDGRWLVAVRHQAKPGQGVDVELGEASLVLVDTVDGQSITRPTVGASPRSVVWLDGPVHLPSGS